MQLSICVFFVTWALSMLLLPTPPPQMSITGTVVYDTEAPPATTFIDMEAFPECAKMHTDSVATQFLVLGDGNTLANVIVRVMNPPGDHQAPKTQVVIDQTGCLYTPHVVAVMAGQPLAFKNADHILHNVHGLPKINKSFNIGMPPAAKEETITLSQPEGPFPVKCDVHPWQTAYVAVMTHPYFAVTGPDGSFSIDNLPPGTYQIEAWHEKLGVQTMKLEVGATGASKVQVAF